jgi:hypothetical protein
MGGACSTNGRHEKFVQNFLSEKPEGRYYSEDLGVEGKIIVD